MDFTYYKIYFIMDIYQIYNIKYKENISNSYRFSVKYYNSSLVMEKIKQYSAIGLFLLHYILIWNVWTYKY